jgi:transcriptional regulator with XRE-family HTH domain
MMNIKEAREQERLTQAETAKILGVSKRTIEEWERGTRNPKCGHDPLVEKIRIAGHLTSEGRSALIDGDLTWEEAAASYKVDVAKSRSGIGRFGSTFSAVLDEVPESVFNALTGEQLAEVIDALKGAYDKGVAYGRANKEVEQ